ncbi:Transcriptional regulator LsrR [Thalassovita autumnalis]|uniref:Transcriptional regulator LsrR n=1 Tax=Thalassovita autumnalis TaxID=2072972 RepID=A0A0N7LWE7_9RHOB|nr:sugar-binding transcriptional regulator [Thalassovita autumnalis]CUH68890.1 Transcriptional regulator LsrR [Thalassovita autumnalis]CUH71422.1 Transcriptional regulator LsrR [Thalassovita autumnalis]
MAERRQDFETVRQIHAVLVLHFIEGKKQSEIAAELNLSTSKVNRLITQGRKLGMLKIEIESPFQRLMDLEEALNRFARLGNTVVTPTVEGSEKATLQQVGRAAASHLTETLRDGDVIAITGGKAVSALVDSLEVERAWDVTVVPLTGGVQGKYFTDVNHLATRLAERLGGKTMLLHAPLFAESQAQRDMLMEVSSIKEVLDLARRANVALVGVGSVQPAESSYYDLHPVPEADRKMLVGTGVVGEFMAHLIRDTGAVANFALNSRLVALSPQELSQCERVIGIAAGTGKVRPIQAALNGGFLDSLIVDEDTAAAVLQQYEGKEHVA